MTIAPPAVAVRRRHHPGLAVLFFTEMWERFSFYCMLSILALYMDESLHFSTGTIGQIYGAYIGLVYFTPLIGGWLADRYLGFRKAILIGGVLMGIGHLCLAFTPLTFFFSGLAFLIAGNGMFKPNVSTILGNLYRDMPEKRDDAYNIFYMGINLGAFFSPLVASYLRNNFGWHYAFGAAGVGMIIALAVFTIFRKTVASGEISAAERANQPTGKAVQLTKRQEKDRIVALLTIFAVVVVFWMVFEQNGFTLTFWARDNTETTISPEIFQSVNPVFILLLTPLLVWFWNRLRKIGKEPATATKIALGMLLTAAAYGVMTLAGWSGGDHGRVGVGWLVGTYGVITVAEILLSPMGLSLVSRLAPPRMAGMLMGTWFAFTALGSYLAGLIGGFWDRMDHSTFFLILVVASLAAFAVLMLVLRKLHGTISEAEQMEREMAQQT
ncbi:MAG TPA: peptide MFS transporter [bacterium]|jgi:POT family proton-dependent oligopeptide transporter